MLANLEDEIFTKNWIRKDLISTFRLFRERDLLYYWETTIK
jgi:hypothetical protein